MQEIFFFSFILSNTIKQKDLELFSVHYSEDHIQQLIHDFEAKTLAKSEWTHAAHLIVSLWHCQQFSPAEALQQLRTKIKTYNESVGTANTDSSGYHETMTRFWIWQTNEFLRLHPNLDFPTLCHAFIHSDYSKKSRPLLYYSRERLFSVEARRQGVSPDLKMM